MEHPPATQLDINGETFCLVLERRRGAILYSNNDRSKYLRIGEPALIHHELQFHKKLIDLGFPVAQILDEGPYKTMAYWIEESLGKEHLGDLFARQTKETGSIPEESFQRFLAIVKAVHEAQEKTLEISDINSDALKIAIGFNDIVSELPEHAENLRAVWEKVLHDLKDWPSCVTHGDFLPHNILEGGVIDFGDHFLGPVGYDMINAITTAWWFPKEPGFEYVRRSSFSKKQTEEYLQAVSLYTDGKTQWDILSKFNALFFLRAIWWAVRNDRTPKLQAWRYERFILLINLYLKNESLLRYWTEHSEE